MKKNLLNLILLAAIVVAGYDAFAQTNVSGAYFTNTIWSISGSPYNVIGDVQFPSGVTLTIDPGVQINYNGNFELLVKGTIIANGTNLLPINFTGNTSGTAMIMFKSTNLTNSQLSHISFNGPKNAFQLGNDPTKNSGVLTVKNVVLTNTMVQTNGNQTTASLVIDSAIVSTTTIKGVYPNSETIEIKNSNLNTCTINSDSYNYGITIRNSFVDNSDFTIGCCGGNISIISSTLSGSTIYNGGGNPVTGPLKIIMSNIVNTPVNLPSAKVEITSSIINYNTSNGLIFGNGFIQCSQITGNGSGTAVKITGYNGYNIGGNVSIKNSTITQNSIGIKITNANTMTIDSSNFDNNSSYNIENLSTKNIIAKNNWWGTTDSATIANKIYDYYDNINYGIVNFSNYLLSAYNSTNCPDTLSFPTVIEPQNITLKNEFNFNIYPNPANDFVNIELPDENNEFNDVTVEIVNPIGQILYFGNLIKSNHTQIIDVSDYNNGIYFCKLQSGQESIVKKLLINR